MLDPVLLRTLIAVVDCGGFSAAGLRLHATQSAVSARIKRLESQVGRSLLTRSTTSGVRLTATGEKLLDAARAILESLDRVERDIIEEPLAGRARIGMTDDYAIGRGMIRALAAFSRQHPLVEIDVSIARNDELLTRLGQDDLDLVLARRITPKDGDLVLRRERLVWMAGTEFAIDPSRPLPLISLASPCEVRSAATGALNQAGRSWRSAFTSVSLSAQLGALKAGLGVAPLTEDLLCPGLRVLGRPDGLPAMRGIHLVLLAGSAASDAFDALREAIVSAYPSTVRLRRGFGTSTGTS